MRNNEMEAAREERRALLLAVVQMAANAGRPTAVRHVQAMVALTQLAGQFHLYGFAPWKGRLACCEIPDDLRVCEAAGRLRLSAAARGVGGQYVPASAASFPMRLTREVAFARGAMPSLLNATMSLPLPDVEGVVLTLWLSDHVASEQLERLLGTHGDRGAVAHELRHTRALREPGIRRRATTPRASS